MRPVWPLVTLPVQGVTLPVEKLSGKTYLSSDGKRRTVLGDRISANGLFRQ